MNRRRTGIALVACLITLVAVPIAWRGHDGQDAPRGEAVRLEVTDRPAGTGRTGAVDDGPGEVLRPSSPSTTSSAPPAVRTRAAGLPPVAAAPAVPVEVAVEKTGLRVTVVPTGVAPDGQLALPDDPGRMGWYRFGPAPASPRGSVVLGGHLDSREYGVGPLVRLGRTRPGDLIELRLSDGSTRLYRTETVRNVDKQALALDDVFDRDGPRRIRLVTCGGEYLPDRGGYQQNLVVTAVPAG